LDTRAKILKAGETAGWIASLLAEQPGLKLVRAALDPLLAGSVRCLREIAGSDGRLIVLLREPAQPILSAAARAELAAALAFVECVVLPADSGPAWLSGLPVIELDDSAETVRLMAVVREKHKDE
jgi:hypothetical protein